jgi:RNA binding exosome subunit
MSQKSPINYIDLRVFVHATEDSTKVLAALHNLLTIDIAEIVQFEKTNLTGHHGNSITLFTTQLTEKKLLPALLEKLGQNINSIDKDDLKTNINLHLEKTNLYLRFDKQAAFLGKIKFTQDDPIHFKIHFKNKTQEEIIALLKKSGLLP